MLGDALWRSRFHADPRQHPESGGPSEWHGAYTVSGIMPLLALIFPRANEMPGVTLRLLATKTQLWGSYRAACGHASFLPVRS